MPSPFAPIYAVRRYGSLPKGALFELDGLLLVKVSDTEAALSGFVDGTGALATIEGLDLSPETFVRRAPIPSYRSAR